MNQTMNDDDDSAKAVLKATEDIIENADQTIAIDSVFTIAAKVGGWLVAWRKSMMDGGFSREWTEECAAILFQKFFPAPEGPRWGPETEEEE